MTGKSNSDTNTDRAELLPNFKEHTKATWQVCPITMVFLHASTVLLCFKIVPAIANDESPFDLITVSACVVALVSAYIRFKKEDDVNKAAARYARERMERIASAVGQSR